MTASLPAAVFLVVASQSKKNLGNAGQCLRGPPCHAKYVFTCTDSCRVNVPAELMRLRTCIPVVIPLVQLLTF